MRIIAAALAAFVMCWVPGQAAAFGPSKLVVPPVGTIVEVTAGQEFYVETSVRSIPAYRIARPFKSSMAGAGMLPFGFAIDETILVFRGRSRDGRWSYFVPAHNAFRAYHGLLGSVIRQGDTVGLRVDDQGRREWYVDNSGYNGFTTIWSRHVKDSDPAQELIETPAKEMTGGPVERLVYLGVEQGRMRIRYEKAVPGSTPVRDEFTFPVDKEGRGAGAVRGAEFTVHAEAVRAQIVVTKAMSGIDILIPTAPEDSGPPRPTT